MLLKHAYPRGFSTFFLTEMWERYGFYVIQTLLIFYLSNELHLDDRTSYIMVGSFTALSYINCIFGGMIADKLIGSSRSIILGGALLSIGYILLTINSNLYYALAVVSIGTGFLKPNISGLLSVLYKSNEAEKENGYTMYYVGIYVGAIGGSFVGGYLQKHFGWSWSFFSSSLGGVISVATFVYGMYRFKLTDARYKKISIYRYLLVSIFIILLLMVSYLVLHSDLLGTLYFILVGILCLIFLLYCIITHHGMQRAKLIAFLLLVLLLVFYWGIYFQQFFSISLCIARTSKTGVPASVFPAVESLGIILFGPVINKVWRYFQNKGQNISIPARFSLGFLFNALGFLLMWLGLLYANHMAYNLNTIFVIMAYLLIAVGELSLSPTSLSMVTSLVPARFTSVMMGMSLLSIGFGGKLAGILANDAAIATTGSLFVVEASYMHSFFYYFMISASGFILVLGLRKYINKLLKG